MAEKEFIQNVELKKEIEKLILEAKELSLERLHAELEKTDDETARITLLTANSVRKRGVHKFEDLVKMVKNPEQFTITGPIIHRITMEDLQSPDYFLKI